MAGVQLGAEAAAKSERAAKSLLRALCLGSGSQSDAEMNGVGSARNGSVILEFEVVLRISQRPRLRPAAIEGAEDLNFRGSSVGKDGSTEAMKLEACLI